ncbi:hypothetical protein T12_12198 [Trichinella patagoniensis]|uniref:Uncharacterized protein n=1 Tax=Trichinella patagoniensis TaxID=990121 RepID=A0A0V0Z9V2_9BILA|nr:hypothetical protein T12_12198 [Trichinella patagoniensis]
MPLMAITRLNLSSILTFISVPVAPMLYSQIIIAKHSGLDAQILAFKRKRTLVKESKTLERLK